MTRMIGWRRKTGRAFLPAILVTLLMASLAHAHAYIEKSEPGDKTVLAEAPAEVRVIYTEPVILNLSTITLLDAEGTQVEGTRQENADNRTLILKMPPLADGVYTVRSKVVGADTHVSEAETFRFAVGAVANPFADREAPRAPKKKNDFWSSLGWLIMAAGVLFAGSFAIGRVGPGKSDKDA